MKRFTLLALPLSVALAQFAPLARAEDQAPPKQGAQAAALAKISARAQQQRAHGAPVGGPRNAPGVQPQQAYRNAAQMHGAQAAYNRGVRVQRRPNPPVYAAQADPRFQAARDPAQGYTPDAAKLAAARAGQGDWSGRTGRGGGDWAGRGGGTSGWSGNTNATSDNQTGRQHWTGNDHGDWRREHHQRDWWRSRYSRFARFGGGYYYWNAGYWYPAYGYDPYFSTYTYDAPLYAYNDLDPGQVIANVQQELQRLGYYQGDLDGTFGPMTRRALLGFQRVNRLPVTGEIDAATLDALGLE